MISFIIVEISTPFPSSYLYSKFIGRDPNLQCEGVWRKQTMNSILEIESNLKDSSPLLEINYIRFCWIWKMNKIAFPFISWGNLVILTGIPTWELETRFDLGCHKEHMVDIEWLLCLLMFIKRKEWGAVSWKSMRH